MKIYNYTGRDIQIYNREDTIIRRDRLYLKNDLVSPVEIIKTCCDIHNLPAVYSEVTEMSLGALTLPVQQFIDAQSIEEFCPDFDFRQDLLIAPNIWTQVVRTRGLIPEYTLIASVYSLVRDNAGRTIGCIGLELK